MKLSCVLVDQDTDGETWSVMLAEGEEYGCVVGLGLPERIAAGFVVGQEYDVDLDDSKNHRNCCGSISD